MINRLSIVAALAALVATPAAAQTWRVQRDTDPFTDEAQVRAVMNGRDIGVAFRCHGGALDAVFAVGYIGEDDATVRLRVDDGEVQQNVWSATTSRDGLFAWDPGELARRMAAGSRMIFEHDDFAGTPHRYTVSLAGSGSAIHQVLDACGVPRQDPRTIDREVWVRAVDDLDKLPLADVTLVQEALGRVGHPVEASGRRSQDTYRKLSDFYADYWRRCEDGETLGSACDTWRTSRRYTPDADYSKEPIGLLAEEVERATSPARTGAAAAGAALIVNPSWDRRPEPAFPERARSRGILEGRVEVQCQAHAGGTLSGCSIISESPAGAGFGQAALSAARVARLSARSLAGAADGARVRFPVPFRTEP